MSNWRARLRVNPSRGEVLHDIAIQNRPRLHKLQKCKETTIVFGKGRSYQMLWKERVTKQQIEWARRDCRHPFTVPDWIFELGRRLMAVYLDGPHHKTFHNSTRDYEIDNMLKDRHFEVKRLEYTTTKSGVKANVDEIEEFVLGNRRE